MPGTPYFSDQQFERLDASQSPFPTGEYEACTFRHCQLAEADLSGCLFTDCRFVECDLSMATLQKTALREVAFEQCKLLGLHFEDANEFGFSVSFKHCLLDLSCFFQRDLRGTQFEHCSLKEVDFSEADLREATFRECELSGVTFDHTRLEGADLRTAYHFRIDPEQNAIRGARFSRGGLAGLLETYEIEVED